MVGDGDRRRTGSAGTGGRTGYAAMTDPTRWQEVDEALRQALTIWRCQRLRASRLLRWVWPLAWDPAARGDRPRPRRRLQPQGQLVFSGRIGERVAAKGVTVIDDGTIPDRRGSLTVDDEGEPTRRTVLIEDGILVGYLQDALNARLMGVARRATAGAKSFAHMPIPRMTNTTMQAGDKDPQEIIASVKKRSLCHQLPGGGQVDITSGKFVFTCTEAYRIEQDQAPPGRRATPLIGSGEEVLKKAAAKDRQRHGARPPASVSPAARPGRACARRRRTADPAHDGLTSAARAEGWRGPVMPSDCCAARE